MAVATDKGCNISQKKIFGGYLGYQVALKTQKAIFSYFGFLHHQYGIHLGSYSLCDYARLPLFFNFLSYLKYVRGVNYPELQHHIRTAKRALTWLWLDCGASEVGGSGWSTTGLLSQLLPYLGQWSSLNNHTYNTYICDHACRW